MSCWIKSNKYFSQKVNTIRDIIDFLTLHPYFEPKFCFNIRSVQNADCRMHCKNMQKVLSKSTTLENGIWKTDWWSMYLSKLDQNHAALPKFIAWRASAMRGLNSLNLGSAESLVASSGSTSYSCHVNFFYIQPCLGRKFVLNYKQNFCAFV